MTLGLWYAKKTIMPSLGEAGCALLLRDQLESLVPVLQRLSQWTQVVYRVDGPDFQDIELGLKSPFNDALLAVTATVTETLRRRLRVLSCCTAALSRCRFYMSLRQD
ncbi:hypothetical protein FJT64_001995 [Amphibalanus amphitrite]|uniref:Uncharacterized protein n=1 Tax=Amphibalanus amphitrite TaxID=1232801 RepID=A0A6A4WSA7_AMPAM|nr:hypothetical protein FJT64_001995 [Amphibalanus amphitrite]